MQLKKRTLARLDKLYDECEAILDWKDPCGIRKKKNLMSKCRGGKSIRNGYCCNQDRPECECPAHSSDRGCTTRNYACKAYLCTRAIEMLTKTEYRVFAELSYLVDDLSGNMHNLPYYRTKENVIKCFCKHAAIRKEYLDEQLSKVYKDIKDFEKHFKA